MGIGYYDFGTYSDESVDYPVYAEKVAEAVASGEYDAGILLCGTGIGISIAANKVKGIRAAVVDNLFCAQAAKEHNNANIITMGGRVVRPDLAAQLVEMWLKTEFAGGRHQRRIDLISEIEAKYFK
jgi:ribose 5-phosphate isomerase B